MAENIDGIYHESKEIAAGTMGTARTHAGAHDLHYYCKSLDSGEIALFMLKPNGTRTNLELERVTPEEFDVRFKPTKEGHFAEPTKEDRAKAEAAKQVNVAQAHLEREEYNAAAFEFGQAIKKDKKNLHARLGKGKAHLQLGEHDKAKEAFEGLADIDELYEKENKHIFNEYGIELRKGELYDTAIENYNKAISLDPEDPALYFNLARAYKEKGETTEATKNLKKALELKPDFNEAKALLSSL